VNVEDSRREILYGAVDMTVGGFSVLVLFLVFRQPFLEYAGIVSLGAGILLFALSLGRNHGRQPVQR
jgi:DMSO reductase anchor subunit